MPSSIIERLEEPNPIQVVNAARVGKKAVKAYRDLPKEQKTDIINIANNFSKADTDRIASIRSFARKFSNSPSGNLP